MYLHGISIYRFVYAKKKKINKICHKHLKKKRLLSNCRKKEIYNKFLLCVPICFPKKVFFYPYTKWDVLYWKWFGIYFAYSSLYTNRFLFYFLFFLLRISKTYTNIAFRWCLFISISLSRFLKCIMYFIVNGKHYYSLWIII